MKALFLTLAISTVLTGCVANNMPRLPKEILDNADYGEAPSGGYKESIKKYFAPELLDPTSPLYTFMEPTKSYTNKVMSDKIDKGTGYLFGWKVCGHINAKNRMGGYAGKAPFVAFIRDNQASYGSLGLPHFGNADYKAIFTNTPIEKVCRRTL